MRKAYKKARWKKMASRVEKRGGMVILGFRKLPNVTVPSFPLTYEGLKAFVDYCKRQEED